MVVLVDPSNTDIFDDGVGHDDRRRRVVEERGGRLGIGWGCRTFGFHLIYYTLFFGGVGRRWRLFAADSKFRVLCTYGEGFRLAHELCPVSSIWEE